MNMFGQTDHAAKHISDRYIQYPSAPYVHETYSPPYVYEPAPTQHAATHGITSKHGHGGHKSSAAMSALTLLAFLFFLNILQQCLKDHMSSMSMPPIMIVTGGREGEDGKLAKNGEDGKLAKNAEDGKLAKNAAMRKTDKYGELNKPIVKTDKTTDNPFVTKRQESAGENFTPVKLAHHGKPQDNNGFPGFVSAMTLD